MGDLKKEFEYFLSHQDDLVKKFNGRVIVIRDDTVIGDYDSHSEAIAEAAKEHAIGTFLVQKVSPGSADYSATYRSRVAFA